METNNYFTNEPQGFYIKQPKQRNQQHTQKKIITLQMLNDYFRDSSKAEKKFGLIVLLATVVILISAAVTIVTGFAGFFITIICPLIIFCILRFRSGKRYNKALNEKSFYITTNECIKKEIHSDSDGDSYVLTFDNGIAYNCLGNSFGFSQPEKNSDEWLYNNTEIGDKFYLLFFSGKKKPELFFALKFFELDMNGFTEEYDGRIVPRK